MPICIQRVDNLAVCPKHRVAHATHKPEIPAVNFKIISRRNGWVTAVGSDGRTVTVSAGGNGR